ncbi:MAG: 4Fe-4S dicluster domain-containing protein [Prevotella sp.]|nr:4Fe-4S dicluster domain-containing protein [Prevotella sp.]MBQ6659078.1 4Fe-4S dicluster domain-containing protein [Prevotella sp.]
MLRKVRITLAAIVFVFITLLFLDITGTLHQWLGWLAKIQFLPALLAMNVVVVILLLALTLIFGRIYCSVICPLGIMQDVISWIHGKQKKNRFSFSKEKKWLRYTMLVLFVIALIAGVHSLVALLAPYSSYGRIVTNLLKPIYEGGNNVLASIAEHFNSYAFYHVDVWIKSLPTFIIAAVTFVVLFVLAWRNGRTYCNTICPVGTFLSFFARFSWMKINFDEEKCKNCGKCSRNCKAACIDYKNHTVDYSRCVVCGNCLGQCNFGALHYEHPKKVKKASTTEGKESVDSARRSFLLGATLASSAVLLGQEKKKVDGGLAKIEDKVAPTRNTHITPPGSRSAKNMASKCTGCQLCVSQCPNEVLRPSTDLLHLMQPEMSYERGYCRIECNRCSEVCPTGAIRLLPLEEKSSTQVGHAVWIKKNCIPVTDGVECGNCERHCPVGAIMMVPLDEDDEESVMIPTVNEARCIGCGACENLCPARPFSAIYVEGHEVHKTL